MRLPLLLSALLFPALLCAAPPLPDGFVHIDELAPTIRLDIRYFGSRNFVGARIDGYEAPRAILTRPAAEALAAVQHDLEPFGLGLKVFDGYRPQRAVDHFVRWAADAADLGTRAEHYPDVEKSQLFAEGYIAERSGHSRGSTVDLTLVALHDGSELDMGGAFDLFSPKSWPDHPGATAAQRANRLLLRTLMERRGFKPYAQEWWHFTLNDEPYPERYFDFPVE